MTNTLFWQTNQLRIWGSGGLRNQLVTDTSVTRLRYYQYGGIDDN
ncbi:hypothetical protein ABHI18_000647 [Aspergillus niger]